MIYALYEDMSRCTPEEVQRLLLLVPEEQQAEALRFKHTFGQFTALKSYLMLKELLLLNDLVDGDDPLRFVLNAHGKPSLSDHPHIHFNISHCPKAIAVAVDNVPIGVDVERFVNPSDSMLRYCMNDAEIEEVRQAVHPEQTFAALWTKKEAYFKLRGTGITKELREILASPHPDVRLTTEIYSEAGFAFTIAETTSKEGAG